MVLINLSNYNLVLYALEQSWWSVLEILAEVFHNGDKQAAKV